MMRPVTAALVSLVLLSSCASQPDTALPMNPGGLSWGMPVEQDPGDGDGPIDTVSVPPYPRDRDLVQLDLPWTSYRYNVYLDPTSLYVGDDGVVRYVTVVRSATGVDNVIAEGLLCATRETRVYAYGGNGRFGTENGPSDWAPLGEPRGIYRYRLAMSETYACNVDRKPYPPAVIVQRTADETVDEKGLPVSDVMGVQY